MEQLGRNVKVTEALDYASGTADRNGATLDMAGWSGVLVLVHSAAIATGATYGIKAQQGAASNLSDAADIAGTAQAIADDQDNTVNWIDVKPTERYVRLVVDNDTSNATAQDAVYIQYGPYGVSLPVTDTDGESFNKAAEGTA